jgi:SAM-dependent methyltransferase
MDISELAREAAAFERRVDRIKSSLAQAQIVWYPYRTLYGFQALDKLLTGPRRNLLDLAGGDPILDLGCADGLTAFFLESMGCDVWAADSPAVNHNHLRGFNVLRRELNSSVPFQPVDLDSQFQLPEPLFGLAVFLGVLYHLKNPFYVLEALAMRARYCLLSTRIARRTAKGTPMKDESLAYFLAPAEANNDATNYWIFSETALRRILDRTGWQIRDFLNTGATDNSEPAHRDRDERAFCLLESRHCPRYSIQLLDGWHDLEQDSYRWTKRTFSVLVKRPHLFEPSTARFRFRLTVEDVVNVNVSVNGAAHAAHQFTGKTEHCFEVDLTGRPVQAAPIRLDFSTNARVKAGGDERELALLVAFRESVEERADERFAFEVQ